MSGPPYCSRKSSARRLGAWSLIAIVGLALSGCAGTGPRVASALRLDASQVDGIYADYKDRSLDSIQLGDALSAAAVGAVTVAIPYVHLVTGFADVAYMARAIARVPYEIGAPIMARSRCARKLEPEDIDNVFYALAEPSRVGDAAFVLRSLSAAAVAAHRNAPIDAADLFPSVAAILDAVGTKTPGFASFSSTSASGGRSLAGFVGTKYAVKAVLALVHTIPSPLLAASAVITPVVSAALNVYIVHALSKAAETYYTLKATACEKAG